MESKYTIIFKDIANKISEGVYKVNSPIPSEASLVNMYGVSRDTIRKSLSILEREGYIQKIKGKGSIVLDIQRYNFSVTRIHTFKEVAETLGKKFVTRVKEFELISPNDSTKNDLLLRDEDKVWRVVRVREIDGEKIILDKEYISQNVVSHITREICEDSLYEYLEKELGLKIACAKKEITIQMANKFDRKYLDMEEYQMVVVVKSYTYLDDATIFHYTESRHRPDKFKFVNFARR